MKHFLPILVALLCARALLAASPNELVPDGGFDNPDANVVADAEQGVVLDGGNRVYQLVKWQHNLDWTPALPPIWNAEYVLSFRIKGKDLKHGRLCLWNRLPDQHEPLEGPIFSKAYNGTFDWTSEEIRFKMPAGVSRFIIFCEFQQGGSYRLDDISMRPVIDEPLDVAADQPSIGSAEREQTCWIWANSDYKWDPNTANQNRAFATKVDPENVRFRRRFEIPKTAGTSVKCQAVFCGDDFGTLWIDGKEIGSNRNLQDVTKIPFTLAPGEHEAVFQVDNQYGPAGLAGRIEWFDAQGKRSFIATNGAWECSADAGSSWKSATIVTVVTPAPTQFHWLYPHLEKLASGLIYTLPKGATRPRLCVRSGGGCLFRADDAAPVEGVSAGRPMRAELTPDAANRIYVELSDISQPPVGQGVLQYTLDGKTVNVSLEQFKTTGGPSQSTGGSPAMVKAAYPGLGWPHNIATFDAASNLPMPSYKHELQQWAKDLLKGATRIWEVGKTDDSSEEFGEINEPGAGNEARGNAKPVALPLADTKKCPRGLDLKLRPEQAFRFALQTVPKNGAAFVLNVEDTDAMVTQVAVFLNGQFVGMPQIVGYDQVPGGRTTNRSWVVTIPKERFAKGENTLTLRVVPAAFTKQGEVMNQSDEYIALMNLRDRKDNPYPTSDWLHWDALSLFALAKEVAEPINGRPVYMGTNLGYTHLQGVEPFEQYIVRDLLYLGMGRNGSPLRIGVWNRGQYGPIEKEIDGVKIFDIQLDMLRREGIVPLLLFEPGRMCNTWEDFEKSNEVLLMKNHGRKIDFLEVGNEVDHPNYRWNQMAMSVAYATIQKQSVMGQALKRYANNPNLRITGEGWYHAWNYGVVDAQARKEAGNDPGFTDHLSAHDYGRSYIQPALQYYSLYGANLGDPKPIWVTECGSWTPNDTNLFEFDVNLRGNIAYVTYIVQYLLHPYDGEMRQFSMVTENGPNAKILEKARIYRRLLHAYAMHGKPIPYKVLNAEELENQLVAINPVTVDGGVKIALVNFTDKPQRVNVELTLGKAGKYTGKRYGGGETVEAATREATLVAKPKLVLKETLAPGETVEYDCLADR